MPNDVVETTLSFLSRVPDILRSARSESLIEFTKPTRVEPIVLLDDRVVHLGFTRDLLLALTSIFSGYYLQAAALSVNVGRIDVIDVLDRVNPNRSLDDAAIKGILNIGLRGGFESAQSYRYGLPYPNQPIGLEHFGLERSVYSVFDEDDAYDADPKAPLNRDTVSSTGKDTVKLAQDVSNLAVGKLLEVEITSENHSARFPVLVRLIPTAAPSDAVVALFSVDQQPRSVKERWHAWRSGQLTFIRDLVLCQDLIDAHKKALIKDPSGVYATSLKRRRTNKLSAIFSGQPSVATASNIVIVSDETRKTLERSIGGRLKDFKTRESLFKSTYTMLFVVVNAEWEAITIYHRSIETPTELSAGDLKFPKSGGGNDVAEILKAYVMGSAPTI